MAGSELEQVLEELARPIEGRRVRADVAFKIAALQIVFVWYEGILPEVISGYRTATAQAGLERAGRPAARDDLSTHRSDPATGVDLSLGPFPTQQQKITLGRIAEAIGLRWGGGSPIVNGIPTDWNHFDVGPRSQS